jgi:hypothetical protein
VRSCLLLATRVSVAKLLNDMPLDRANRLYLHPIHQDTYKTLVSLISDLRQCRSFEDFHHFQQALLEEILEIQGCGKACAWVAKRLRKGRTVPAGAPELRSGGDVYDPESWELEADVCERVERQLRSIADALAWRVFNYDRPVIVALSRNELAGPMIGKEGLEEERRFVLDTWRDDGNFVLLHDPTTCLRIGDATEFKPIGTNGWEAYLHEIKKDRNRKRSQQQRRKRLAEEAIRDGGALPNDPEARLVTLDVPYKTHLSRLGDAFRLAAERGVVGMKVHGGPLPGGRPDARLVELTEPYVTNLKQLGDLIELAKRHGCRGMKLSQGRALVASSVPRVLQRWGQDLAEANRVLDSARQRAIGRAEIDSALHHVKGFSSDTASRSPIMAPWSIYPFSPLDCASLICDLLVFETTVSAQALVESLERAGLTGEALLTPADGQLGGEMGVIRAH